MDHSPTYIIGASNAFFASLQSPRSVLLDGRLFHGRLSANEIENMNPLLDSETGHAVVLFVFFATDQAANQLRVHTFFCDNTIIS